METENINTASSSLDENKIRQDMILKNLEDKIRGLSDETNEVNRYNCELHCASQDLPYWLKKPRYCFGNCNLQNIFTPMGMGENVITCTKDKIRELAKKIKNDGRNIEEMCILTLNYEDINDLLLEGAKENKIWFWSDCHRKLARAKTLYKSINLLYNGYREGFNEKTNEKDSKFLILTGENKMKKFDVIIGNPPYNTKSGKEDDKTQSIWEGFVEGAFKNCKDMGYVCLIHPSGWRGNGKAFKKSSKILKEKHIMYLEIHNEQDGLNTFKVSTRYDWYIAKNTRNKDNKKTTIVDQDKHTCEIDLSVMPFIPNTNIMIQKVFSMLAKNGEEKTKIICDSSYHSQNGPVSKEKTKEFKYPIVYSTTIEGPTIWYSSTNEKGHFGEPKVILNTSRPVGFFIDYKGEYGISQFCAGIVGDKKYLEMVAEVIKNQKTNGFVEFMESCHFTDKIFNKDVISLFRKDFWKEFV